jgi:hypothetical protein
MIRRCIIAGALAVVAATGLAAASSVDDACVYPFSKGTGLNHISWCVSSGGNIVRLKSPIASEHIGTTGAYAEGLMLCQSPTGRLAYDTGIDQAGFSGEGPQLVDLAPLTIDRVVTGLGLSPLFKIRQKFTTDYAEKELVVAMTITNLTSEPQSGLMLRRVSDLNVESQQVNFWHNSAAGNWAAHHSIGIVMGLVRKGAASPGEAYVTTFNALLDCFPDRFGGTLGPVTGDYAGAIDFSVGTLGPGNSKTFTYSYRRY